ncbi:hypothetical protein PIB30_041169 [Stylosanthes scabra]|uniref:Uncharacterized protein n=1 Tax=Stylosanthes scabra TaxID=79078 RepID=A0ABU6VEX3_9FABA|nr:hypothetical protein [Stylosanthes scabra]
MATYSHLLTVTARVAVKVGRWTRQLFLPCLSSSRFPCSPLPPTQATINGNDKEGGGGLSFSTQSSSPSTFVTLVLCETAANPLTGVVAAFLFPFFVCDSLPSLLPIYSNS